MPERNGGIRCSSDKEGHCCVCNRALPENTPYPRVNKGGHCVSSCFSRLFLFGCVPSFVACAKHAKCGKKIAILNHRLIPLCNLSDLLFSALCGGYNKKRMRRINGAFAFVVLSFRSRLIGWGGIPRMLPLLRRMPSRGGCKVVQLRGCDLRHVARTSGRRRRGMVHFPSAIDV